MELPDLDQDQHGDVDAKSVTAFYESSEIELEDHRDVEYEPKLMSLPYETMDPLLEPELRFS